MFIKLITLFTDVIVFSYFLLWRTLVSKKLIILSNRYGNIGNQLYMSGFLVNWSYAFNALTINYGLVGYQNCFQHLRNDFLIRFPSCKDINHPLSNILLKIFSQSANRISLRFINSKIFSIYSHDLLTINTDIDYQTTLRKILKANIIFVRGFIRHRSYNDIIDFHSIIKKHYKPASELQNKITEPIKKLSQSDVIIGVAIRQGDYRNWKDGRYFIETKTYIRWMIEIKKFFKNESVGFFIASDEKQDLSLFSGLNYFFRKGHPISNLYSLSLCDYVISVPSSFVGWAHFIGKIPCLTLDKKVREIEINDFKII